MSLQASGTIKMSEINTELGRSSSATISLDSAESGVYATINTASPSYPDDNRPASMSEWYSYNHTAAASNFFNVINSGQSTSSGACALEGPDDLTLYHGTGSGAACPVIGRYVYTDSGKTLLFNGQGLYWQSPGCGEAYLITAGGYIENVVSCFIGGTIAEGAGGAPNESCAFNTTIPVYKSGTSQTPSSGESIWQDSNMTIQYVPGAGYNQWYAYTPSGSSTKYALYLINSNNQTVIEGLSVCR